MKKKGFTLVELLAVIAILAILVIIALPNVLRMFRNAKENTFVTEVQEIIKTAEQGYISGSLSNKECKCFSNASNPLDLSGRDNIQYYVEFNDKGQVINLTVKDDTYQFVSENEVIKIADIGSSTSGKAKTTSLALESTEVPTCDGSSGEDTKIDIKYDSMLMELPDYTECEYNEGTGFYFCAYSLSYLPPFVSGNIESMKITNTNKVPEGVFGSMDVSNDNSGNIMMWWTYDDVNKKYEVTIGGDGGVRANTNSSNLFSYMPIESIDLTYLDTSKVTDMSWMFSRCRNLASITYGDKFVINKDTKIYDMFEGTDKLENDKFKSDPAYADRFNEWW